MGSQPQPAQDGNLDPETLIANAGVPLSPSTRRDSADPKAADPEETISATHDRDCTETRAVLQPGDVLERRFVVVRLLGCGGMGEVYEAEDLRLNKARVALKTIKAEYATEPWMRQRFQQELLLARSISHPNVCPVYEMLFSFVARGEICFLTMKLLSGETLASRLDSGVPLGTQQVSRLARDIAAALHAAHQANIIHRDLKPGNIFVEKYHSALRAVVTDFGLARDVTASPSLTRVGAVVGTPPYLAPELLLGAPATIYSDIYSFGVVLHETLSATLQAVAKPARAHRRLAEIADRCMQRDPHRRFRSAADVLDALGLVEERAPIILTRRKALAGLAAGCGAFAGAGWMSREWLQYMMHPVPRPRRVAVLPTLETKNSIEDASLLNGVLDSVSGELARAEATEQDLFVVPPYMLRDEKVQEMSQALGMFGANLVLTAALKRAQQAVHLEMRLTMGAVGKVLRSAELICQVSELYTLPVQAAEHAAKILDIRNREPIVRSVSGDTTNAQAFAAYARARDLLDAYELSNIDKGIKELQKAVDLDPTYARAYALLGEAYATRYHLTQDPAALDLAQRNSDKAVSLAPELPSAYASRATVANERGLYEASIRDLQTAMRLDPTNVEAQFTLAHTYAASGNLEQADRIYERLLHQRPNMWTALNDWALIYERRANYKKAERLFREASNAAPQAALPWRNLGAICLLTDQPEESKRAFDRSIALLPTGIAYSNRGTALFWSGKYLDATADYHKAIRLSPGDYDLWRNLGDAYSMLSGMRGHATAAWGKAAELATGALAVNPKDADILTDLAVLEAKLGHRESALELLSRAHAQATPTAERLFAEVQTHELAGQRETALKLLAECMRLGYSPPDIAHSPELQALRKDSRFKSLGLLSNGSNLQER